MQAVVFHRPFDPVPIQSVEVDVPQSREVLVRTVATGVCHSDLHLVDGDLHWPTDHPVVLGHEGAGLVEAVGADVTAVRSGDHVVACLSGFCGVCPQCMTGTRTAACGVWFTGSAARRPASR